MAHAPADVILALVQIVLSLWGYVPLHEQLVFVLDRVVPVACISKCSGGEISR